MLQLELTAEEAGSLAKILAFYLSELRMEIAGTKRLDMRNAMKGEEVFIKGLLQRLEAK